MAYMDQTKQNKIRFSKKSTQILLSISAFSVLFSLGFLPLVSQFISEFSKLMLSYTPDRNYIFLFCNGILVFLIKNSGLAGDSSMGSGSNNGFVNQKADDQKRTSTKLDEKRQMDRDDETKEKEEEEQGKGHENLVATGGTEDEFSITRDEFEEEDEAVIVEGQENEEFELLSAEELHKKCDDFIRKVREGIKFEARSRR